MSGRLDGRGARRRLAIAASVGDHRHTPCSEAAVGRDLFRWARCSRPGSFVGLALLLFAPGALAQSVAPAPLRLSLDEAIERAERASDEVSLATYGVQAARGAQLQARSGFFPRLAVSASYQRTLASEFDAAFSAPEGSEAAGINLGELPFGRANMYGVTASVSQNLFSGGATLAATRQAGSLRRQSQLELVSAHAQTVLAGVEAYYDALLADRFVGIAGQALEQAQQTLERVKLSRLEGQQSEFDLLRARVAFDNEQPNLAARRMERDLAYLRLRQRLGLPLSTPLELTSALDDASRPLPTVQRRERAPVQVAREAVEASRAGVQGAHAGHYPSLDLSMSYGKVNYPDQLLPSSDWRTNWTITALASWPLFEGFRTRGQELAAQAELGQARVRLAQIEKQAAYESEQVVLQLRAAEAVLQASAATTEQARKAYAIAEMRFGEGISTQLELSDARLALAQSETNRARAVRDVRVARVRLALLPELPLSGAAPAPGAPLTPQQVAPSTANASGRAAGSPLPLEPSLPAMPASARGF